MTDNKQRSIISTVDAILPRIPDGEPVKRELASWRESVFLELPENNAHQWHAVAMILGKHFPSGGHGELNAWQRDVVAIWKGKCGPMTDETHRRNYTPDSLGKLIRLKAREIDRLKSDIREIASHRIHDFHFLDYEVSTCWRCEQSPVGMCVFRLTDRGHKTVCRYCGKPPERK